MKVICDKCGKTFNRKRYRVKQSKNNYCSRKCYQKKREEGKKYVKCLKCGKLIYKNPARLKGDKMHFCSLRCSWDYQIGEHASQHTDEYEIRHCLVCSKKFKVTTIDAGRRPARCCSPKCNGIYIRKTKKTQDRYTVKCDNCGKKFEKTRCLLRKRNFCSRHCASEAHSNYIKGKKNGRYVHGNQSGLYPGEFRKIKVEIRDRDELRCVLCGCKDMSYGRHLDVHHIDYNKNNCKKENLITLCKCCHGKTHHHREKWKKLLLKKLKELN